MFKLFKISVSVTRILTHVQFLTETFFLRKNFEQISSDRTINLQFSHMFFDVAPFLLIVWKIFCTFFTVFTPLHPRTNDDTLKLFFIKMFQFFFRRIKIACIFIGRVTLERLLGIVKFILQYVLLIFFSLELRFENCTACALRYT